MNRLLLGTTLLLPAGFFGLGQSAHAQAAPVYSPTVINITSPLNGSTQHAPIGQLAEVPCTVTGQGVTVTGATPLSFVKISWSMQDQAYDAATTPNDPYIANDTGGPTLEMIKPDGTFTRYVNGSASGNVSQTVAFDPRDGGLQGFYAFVEGSAITDPSGTLHSASVENTFVIASP